jgi:hypothetical protein
MNGVLAVKTLIIIHLVIRVAILITMLSSNHSKVGFDEILHLDTLLLAIGVNLGFLVNSKWW